MNSRHLPPLDPVAAANAGVVAYLCRTGTAPLLAVGTREAYMHAGSHPDIVEQVWDNLGASLSKHCRCLVGGTPALVHLEAGVILATALGTSYALRLPVTRLPAATAAGLVIIHTYTTSRSTLDLASFGPQWRFGAFHRDEPQWCAEAAAELEAPPRPA